MSIHLQRRPHTRKALPVVIEMDEEIEEIQLTHSRRRPRPAPIFTPYHGLPILFDTVKSIQTPLSCIEKDPDFSLSPSLLFSRRKSETVLEFPVPAKHTSQTPASVSSPVSSPPRYSSASPVSSNSSSSYPDTPSTDSEDERQSLQVDDVFAASTTPSSVHRQPYRTPSALSLKSFATAEFDAHAASIYNLLRSSPASPPPSAPLPTRPHRHEVSAINIPSGAIAEDWVDVDSELVRIPRQFSNNSKRKSSIVLSIQGGLTEATFQVPFLMQGNFLDIDASDEDSEIEFEFDEATVAVFPPLNLTDGLASSDEESDEDYRWSRSHIARPNKAYDPDMTHQTARRGAITKPQFLVIPSLPSYSPSSPSSRPPVAPASSPVPSVQSSFNSRLIVPPRESIVPKDIDFDDLTSPVDNIRISFPVPQERRTTLSPKPTQPRQISDSPVRFISPFTPAQLLEDDNDADDDEPDRPILRSRFSSSTINSISEPSQSSPLASPGRFLARLLRSPTSPVTSKHTSPIPLKNPIRVNTIDTPPLKYRKSPTIGTRSSSLQPSSPSPPGRRPSKSLELYDKPLPYASTRNDLSSNQKHHPSQQGSASSPKRFPSRSSLDTTYSLESSSSTSILSAGSSSSTGLRRPPIPVELFIKH